MSCNCDRPTPGDKPDYCRRCLRRFDPAWLSSDEHIYAFFSELADLPEMSEAFVDVCVRREREGRVEYGLKYLADERSNPMEAVEEAADLAIYSYLHLLKCERDGVTEKREYALAAAYHAAQAYNALMSLRYR